MTNYKKRKKMKENHKVKTEISIGELVDKITILEIKLKRIKSKEKLENIQKELSALLKVYNKLDIQKIRPLQSKLSLINEQLWIIEDDIRDKERKKEFDNLFIELARSVYITNDKRFNIKEEINNLFNSNIKEVKSYQNYN